jgi:hypothetical protein
MSIQKDRRLLDEVREYMLLHHYSIHTERTYCDWIKKYIRFHNMQSRDDLSDGEKKIENFLTQAKVKRLHENDLAEGFGEVYMPHALARKYPKSGSQWGWQYIFPPSKLSTDPRSKAIRRHHMDPSVIHKAIKAAVKKLALHRPFVFLIITPNRVYGLAAKSFPENQAAWIETAQRTMATK